MQWFLVFCSTLSIRIFASLPCAECLKTWPRWTVLPQSVSSCNVSTSASIYPYVGKGRNARGDQSELLVEPIAKEHHVGIVHIWLSDYKEISITYVLSFGNLKFTHIWTKYTCALWFWSSLKNNLKVQNNNFLRNNHRCCFWFCSNNFPFGSLKLLSDFLKNTLLLIFSTDIRISGPRCPFTLQGTGAYFELFLQNSLSFSPAYVVERRCLQEQLCWDLGVGGKLLIKYS